MSRLHAAIVREALGCADEGIANLRRLAFGYATDDELRGLEGARLAIEALYDRTDHDLDEDPIERNVRAAMLRVAATEHGVEYSNTGGGCMALCFDTFAGREVLIGEDGAQDYGFGWCVQDADGSGGVNYSVNEDCADWSVDDWAAAFRAVVASPEPSPHALDIGGDFLNVESETY